MKKWLIRIIGSILFIFALVLLFFYQSDISRAELWDKYAFKNSQTIDINGMPAHYRITGEGDAILLLHGTAASLHTWAGWTEKLKENYQVIAVDLPGFGMTGPHPEGDYSIPAYVDFVEEFRKTVGLDTFALAGNSLGGLIAWNYAASQQGRVSELILVDPAGFPFDQGLPFAFRLAQNKITSPGVRFLTPKSLVKKSLLDVYGQDELVTDQLVDQYFEMLLREGNRQAFIDRVNETIVPDTSLLTTLQMPVLIMWGVKDAWIPVEHAMKFSAAIPNDTLITYDELGHVPMEEAPDLTVAAVEAFLE